MPRMQIDWGQPQQRRPSEPSIDMSMIPPHVRRIRARPVAGIKAIAQSTEPDSGRLINVERINGF
jgi:hypothetical protein